MMRREVIEDYKDIIETPEEMVWILTTIRDHMLKHYSIYYGWSLQDTISLLNTVLKLNKEIRYLEEKIGERSRLSIPT